MHPSRNRSSRPAVLLAAVAVALVSARGRAEEPKAAAVMEPEALATIRRMSERLAAAKAFTVKARSSMEVPASTGQMLDFFTTSEVTVARPDRLRVVMKGDRPAMELYYDGKTVTVVDPAAHLYARADAPDTLDAMIDFVMEKGGIYFPFVDVLLSDPYTALTKDVTSAFIAGRTDIGGVTTEHVACAGPGIEWQAWIDVEHALPRLLAVTYTDVPRQPRFQVALSDWNLVAKPSPATFAWKKPAGAIQVELRAMDTKGG